MAGKQVMINKIVTELSNRELKEHLGRWTQITMKKSGRILQIVRTGYGPMEYPERDEHEVKENGKVIATGRDLWDIAEWILTQN